MNKYLFFTEDEVCEKIKSLQQEIIYLKKMLPPDNESFDSYENRKDGCCRTDLGLFRGCFASTCLRSQDSMQ
jgi:tetrahydromethanopterin S-methyltransferase subunit B